MRNWGVERDGNGQVAKDCLQGLIYYVKEVFGISVNIVGSY